MERQPVLGHYFLQPGTTLLDGGILSRPHTPWRDLNTLFGGKTFSLKGNITGKFENQDSLEMAVGSVQNTSWRLLVVHKCPPGGHLGYLLKSCWLLAPNKLLCKSHQARASSSQG